MPEGVAAGGQISEPTFDNPKAEPPADPKAAPNGWTWDRAQGRWRPRKRMGRAGMKGRPEGATDTKSVSSAPDDREGQDPDPAWFASSEPKIGGSSRRRQTIDDVDKETLGDIAGFAGLVGAPLLAMLQQIDPYCGTVLANAYEGVVDACLPLICRSERIVNYFRSDQNDWLLWGKLALALRPVAQAVLAHHVFRTVDVVRDQATGQVHVIQRSRGDSEHGDHLQPQAQGEPDYAQYAA